MGAEAFAVGLTLWMILGLPFAYLLIHQWLDQREKRLRSERRQREREMAIIFDENGDLRDEYRFE